MIELKGCPFCGSLDLIVEPYYDESYVRCQSCDCDGPTGEYEECQIKWNQRNKTGEK